jgi:hypothetical protein
LLTGVGLSGCFIELSPLEDDGTGGTGGDTDQQAACVLGNTMCNGVELFCKNHNVGGGADDTGGDGGAAPNYWWRTYDPGLDGPLPEETEIPSCSSAGSDDTHCALPNAVLGSPGCCLTKEYHDPMRNDHAPSVPICVGSSFPAPVDPLGPEWESGYPSIQPEIRTSCSEKCENNNWSGYGQAPPACEDDQWSGFETRTSWDPPDGYNCVAPVGFHQNDPHGANVPWHLVGGSTAPAPLSCALDDECADWFYPHVAAFVNTPGRADFIDPETRNASYLAIEEAGSRVSLKVNASGTGAGVDDTEPVFGLAEYTPLDCGETVCPFFLANLTAFNTSSSWEVRIDTDIPGVRLQKSVSDLQVDLLQSTLGIHHVGLGKVAFAPNTLRLRVEVTIANNGTGNTYGNGTHVALVENDQYVFATYANGALSLTHTFQIQSGQGTLALRVVPDERPPVAEHDLGTTEACDTPGGLLLDASHVLSTDPDDDIVIDSWLIDDQACGTKCIVPYGAHQVAVEAIDARGAVDVSPNQWVNVTSGCG